MNRIHGQDPCDDKTPHRKHRYSRTTGEWGCLGITGSPNQQLEWPGGVVSPIPLPPHDRRLRSGRYEVSAFSAPDPVTTARRCLSGPHRFATLADARTYASTLSGHSVCIDRVAPVSSRYPDGPWQTTSIQS